MEQRSRWKSNANERRDVSIKSGAEPSTPLERVQLHDMFLAFVRYVEST